jgi:hypothetical protein
MPLPPPAAVIAPARMKQVNKKFEIRFTPQ